MTLTELSAPAETSRVPDGLNAKALIAKEWACRILRSGCRAFRPRVSLCRTAVHRLGDAYCQCTSIKQADRVIRGCICEELPIRTVIKACQLLKPLVFKPIVLPDFESADGLVAKFSLVLQFPSGDFLPLQPGEVAAVTSLHRSGGAFPFCASP